MRAGVNDITKVIKRRDILKVKEMIIHPGYINKKGTTLHDIGIMVLERPIPMIRRVTEPVKLAHTDLPIGNKGKMQSKTQEIHFTFTFQTILKIFQVILISQIQRLTLIS